MYLFKGWLFAFAIGNFHFLTVAFKDGCKSNTIKVASRKEMMWTLLQWGGEEADYEETSNFEAEDHVDRPAN